ncbi:M20 family metallopeptidase [Euzebya tangerina]|uniref:M20 family metallopeptidase n=1 Tax=Euzebya tangerina TaxID=591198 RepID=UPI00196AE8F8|nr:M20 family metallopeptidase [Euzebya tangerina]
MTISEEHPAPPPDYSQMFERLIGEIERHPGVEADSEVRGAEQAVLDGAGQAVERHADALVDLSHDIHDHPELAYEETYAADAVSTFLTERGHETTPGAYGLDTAVHVRAGEGHPRVAFLAEYDALPGIGHACGHNVICTTAVGGFLAAATQLGTTGGSVELIGTPAEEGGGGKEAIARAGGFDDVDAVVMLHPFFADVAEHPFIGVRTVVATFTGINAHAAALPFLGRNALDAAVQAYTGIAQLRQHMLPTDRVHGVFTDGGAKPNIVPDRAEVEFYVRSAEPATLQELCTRVDAIFQGAAIQAGCSVEVTWDRTPVYMPTRLNGPLSQRYAVHATARGRRVLPGGVIPEALTGSTDLGNVSVRVPSIHALLDIAPFGVSLHTPEFAAFARSETGDAGVTDGAYALAGTALDYLSDADLRAAVDEDFAAGGGVVDVEALYP